MPKNGIPVLGTNFVLELGDYGEFPLLSFTLGKMDAAKIEEFAVDKKGSQFKRVAAGLPKNTEITFSRAFVAGDPKAMVLFNWHKQSYESSYEKAKSDGAITGYDVSFKPLSKFTFTNSWPKTYKWPALDAKGGTLLVEEITLSCDYWTRD